MNGTQLTELEQRIRTDCSNIAGMVVRKNGKTVYEGCFGGCTPDSRIHVFSVTKSIVSILFGIALDKCFLDSMLPYFQVLPFAKILFQDLTFSGIALLIVNGLSNLTAAALLLAKKASGCSSERRVRRDADALDLYPVLHVSAEFYVNRILLFRAHAGAYRLCGLGV